MYGFIGLGNPGKEYAFTRHNIGFMVIDRFAERHGISVDRHHCKSVMGEGFVDGQKVFLLKPLTYMNLSGEAVRAFLDFYKFDLNHVLIIYDDLDTPFGKIRLRYKGSSGGHNGIKSIISHIGTEQFKRMRMGISRPERGTDMARYVLSPFSKSERENLESWLDTACDALEWTLKEPFEKVMAKFNR